MKCKKCGGVAVINMRHHRLALCADHFVEWFISYTQRAIEKYHMFGHDDQLLVAVSGGKDSLALWDVLAQLGYRASSGMLWPYVCLTSTTCSVRPRASVKASVLSWDAAE